MTEAYRKEACRHEAAHAVVALHFNYRVKKLLAWGKHYFENSDKNIAHYQGPNNKEHLATIAAAGLTVTEIANGGGIDAKNILKYIHGDKYKDTIPLEDQRKTITQYVNKAKDVLNLYIELHDEITDALLEQSILGEGEIRELQYQYGRKLSVQEKMVLEARAR